MFFSIYKHPPELIDFLTSKDLLEFVCLNTYTYDKEIEKRKKIHAYKVITYFYSNQHVYSKYNISISLYKVYDEQYLQNVRCLFHVLPELFEFIETKNITVLELSCIAIFWKNKYESVRYTMNEYMYHSCMSTFNTFVQPYLYPLLENIRSSHLVECNIGVFRDMIDKQTLVELIQKHTTLTQLSTKRIVPMDIDNDQSSLYKLENGDVIWSIQDPYSYSSE